MDPLSVTASTTAVLQLLNKVLGYLKDVKDASKDRAKCTVEASNIYRLLVDLRSRLEEGSTDARWYTAFRTLGIENGPLDQFRQALEELQTRMTDGGRLQKAGKALVWKFKKEETASILDRIERLKTLVGLALQTDHLSKLSQATKDDTNFIRTHVPAIQSGVDRIQHDQAKAMHSKIVEWISPTNYPAQQSDTISRRQKGTGQWFLDAPEFTTWLGKPRGTLFCPGIPGAGKTIVAAIAIDYLLKSVQSSSVGLAYVYCNYKAQEEQGTSSILAAIVKQLVQGQSLKGEPVERLHKQHADRGTKPSLEEIFDALQEVVAMYPKIYVVVDALDECRNNDGTRSQLLARLRDLQVGADVRIMATSRYIPEIEDGFQTAMKLEIRASDEDVRQYIAGQEYRLPRCIRRDPALQTMIQDKLVKAVGGMFLLARLHTDSLLDKRTVKEVKLTLDRQSKGSAALNDAYDKAIQRIDGQLDGDKQRAKKVLSWITYARRPLTTTELRYALAVERDTAELDPENMPDIEDLLSVCAGLVVVDQESAIVRLVHYTTQDYFERIRDAWDPDALVYIASTCLTYLSFDLFKTGSCSSIADVHDRLRLNPFLDYTVQFWGQHALPVQHEVCDLACSFLLHKGSISCVTQVMERTRHFDDVRFYRHKNFIHLAAQFGLDSLLKKLLEKAEGKEMLLASSKRGYGDTGLFIAAANGHDKIVGLLIDRVGLNLIRGEDGDAFQEAASRGHEQVVNVLLDNGADVYVQLASWRQRSLAARNSGCRSPIQYPSLIYAQARYYNRAIWKAAKNGHERVVKILLEKAVGINVQGGHNGNAFYAASEGGHEAIVKLLLQEGAKVDGKLRDGALGEAVRVCEQSRMTC
ncbi:hypothetical protein SLS60_005784 [Paraconiothyrium brasiliense]|uniref:Ankyrin repeat protein n=1 Tax=Paraconiothyrium brasiliense TaxID=300254 RepID=A0ABR3RDR2_9PLEO